MHPEHFSLILLRLASDAQKVATKVNRKQNSATQQQTPVDFPVDIVVDIAYTGIKGQQFIVWAWGVEK